MANGGDYESDYDLNMPFDEALDRFSTAARDESGEVEEPETGLIPEGETQLALYRGREIRKIFHNGEWWFSVIDVVAAVADTQRARGYWSDLKRQLSEKEGFSELSENIGQLPLPAVDGKKRATDVANTETCLRIIQSIPSPRAEPVKRWLARVGYERIQETQNPEIAIKRAILTYQLQGRTDDWIDKRVRSIVVRKELTSEWKKRGVDAGKEYAILTNVMSEETFGLHTNRHKKFKGLKDHHSLRDHMTDLELIFTMLSESSTRAITKQRDAYGFRENELAARSGGKIAGSARKELEQEIESSVVSGANFLGKSKRSLDPEKLTRQGRKAASN